MKWETAEVDQCNLFLWNFFWLFLDDYVSLRELILWLRKSLVSSLVFEITLVDTLQHFYKILNCFAHLSCFTNNTKLKNNRLKLQGSQAQVWAAQEILPQRLGQSTLLI